MICVGGLDKKKLKIKGGKDEGIEWVPGGGGGSKAIDTGL